MPSFSVMRWVKHGHTDSPYISFYDFIHHIRSEQQFTVPRPCMEFPIPDKPSSWESIAQRLVDHPQDARRAEVEGMIRTGPKKDAEEADRLQSLTASEQTQGIEEDPEAPSDPFEILTCSPSALLYTRCIMCLPTPEDKYMALSQMKDLGPHPDLPAWKERPDAAVMHHIVYFEDLQATGEEVTGYAVKYDFMTNQILIKRTQGIPPKTGGVTLDLWPPSSGGKNLNLFVGTPAKLTDHILSKQPIASDPGFDLVLKIIVAEVRLFSQSPKHPGSQ